MSAFTPVNPSSDCPSRNHPPLSRRAGMIRIEGMHPVKWWATGIALLAIVAADVWLVLCWLPGVLQ